MALQYLCAYVFCINFGIHSLSNFLTMVHLFASAAINFIFFNIHGTVRH